MGDRTSRLNLLRATAVGSRLSLMQQTYNLEDVFKLNGVPDITFVRPVEFPRLLVALRTHGRGVVIEGPSGIGKTSAVTKALEELEIYSDVLTLSA